mgnify:FL=1
MKRRVKHKKKKSTLYLKRRVIALLVLILIVFFIFIIVQKEDAVSEEAVATATINKMADIIDESACANVSRYIVYGTHLNVEGNINFSEGSEAHTEGEEAENIRNAEVVARNVSGDEVAIKTTYTQENGKLSFSTLDKINTGLNLESLDVADYCILLKVQYEDDEVKYYSLKNDTEYKDSIDYYTLTRNGTNNKIYISFASHENVSALTLDITKVSKLPENVYDVVVDPGHGESDVGAVSGRYQEADIALDCALKLKSQLEDLGLKVLLTRDGSETDEYSTYNIYDDDGRVTMANESGAKLLVSLHLNSNDEDIPSGGVEVYAPTNSNLSLAKSFADNIVNTAHTTYSQMETYKEAEGVYVRTIEVDSSIRNYKGIFDSVPYLFIIREVGGIATGAFVDGTNPSYAANKYRNTNVGIEGYLIELGYINVDEDLENILNNEDLYAKAIAESINSYYKIK